MTVKYHEQAVADAEKAAAVIEDMGSDAQFRHVLQVVKGFRVLLEEADKLRIDNDALRKRNAALKNVVRGNVGDKS